MVRGGETRHERLMSSKCIGTPRTPDQALIVRWGTDKHSPPAGPHFFPALRERNTEPSTRLLRGANLWDRWRCCRM